MNATLEKTWKTFGGWYLVCGVVSFLLLNALADHESSGLQIYYRNFASIIRSHFDPTAGRLDTATFPMWGYGFLALAIDSPIVLSFLQFSLSLLALAVATREFERSAFITEAEVSKIRWVLVLSLPWYSTALSAYSASTIGAALLWLSLSGILTAVRSKDFALSSIIASGSLYGAMLNFRSDFLFAAVIPIVLLIAVPQGSVSRRIFRASAWILVVGLWLAPWACYTKRASGQWLLSSSNSGHVLFIGLGNLPNNSWGITSSDGDPAMREAIRARFGDARSSLRPDTSAVLTQEFRSRVLARPLEYLYKCTYVVATLTLDGFYPGVFDETFKSRLRAQYPTASSSEIILHHFRAAIAALQPKSLLLVLSELQGRLLLWATFTAIAVGRVRQRLLNPVGALLLMFLFYQLAVNVLACHLRMYMNNQILTAAVLSVLLVTAANLHPSQPTAQE